MVEYNELVAVFAVKDLDAYNAPIELDAHDAVFAANDCVELNAVNDAVEYNELVAVFAANDSDACIEASELDAYNELVAITDCVANNDCVALNAVNERDAY